MIGVEFRLFAKRSVSAYGYDLDIEGCEEIGNPSSALAAVLDFPCKERRHDDHAFLLVRDRFDGSGDYVRAVDRGLRFLERDLAPPQDLPVFPGHLLDLVDRGFLG